PDPVLLVVAEFSRHADAIDWGRRQLEQHFGPVALVSPIYEFNQTRYYEQSMGPGLRKCFLAFQDLVRADCLADVKRRSNDMEEECAGVRTHHEPPPPNLDPGLLALGKFLLAPPKDQSHRVYLRDGIYAEATLRYHAGAFEPWPWTYADYRLPLVLDFLQEAR